MGLPLNDVNCDIYIGKGAGKMLLKDIDNATKELKVVSPYLSSDLVNKMIRLHKQGVKVKLITMEDGKENFYGYNNETIRELVRQHVHVDEYAVLLRERYKNTVDWLLYAIGGTAISLYLTFVIWPKQIGLLPLGIVVVITLFLIRRMYDEKYKSTRTYSYSYSQLFDFNVFKRNYSGFIHSKMYIIDGRIAYLGSLNLTRSGTESHYESRIRITDPLAVQKISSEIDWLFDNNELDTYDVEDWGRNLYREPRN